MNDHIKALFEGQELSEEYKQKVESILENVKSEIRETVEKEQRELFESQIEEKTKELEELSEKYVEEEVIPTISKYLTATVNEWLEENQVALESGVKVELAESFLKGFVGLAEEHNLSVPDGSDSIVEKTQKELEDAKKKLDELTEKNIELRSSMDEQTRKIVTDRVCSDLTESQKEKFVKYASNVDFKNEEQFEEAITSLRESYFPSEETTKDKIDESEDKTLNEDEINEDEEQEEEDSPYYRSILEALKKGKQ